MGQYGPWNYAQDPVPVAANDSDILNAVKNVDGPGSGLNADLLDGLSSAEFALVAHTHTYYVPITVSDETTDVTTGAAKVTFRMPRALTLTGVRASLTEESSAGIVTVDINEGGVSIFVTPLTIDVGERTSTTAAIPAVLLDTALADDAEITIDVDITGTGAKGLKVLLIGT